MSVHDGSRFEESFSYFWETIIYPIINRSLLEVDPDFKEACNFRLAYSNIEDYRNDLMLFYKEKRDWLKQVYLPHDNAPMLDIHKLGAILCRSLCAYKPFYFDYSKAEKYIVKKFTGAERSNNLEWFLNNVYANYKVAFYSSVGLIFLDILYTFESKDLKAFEYLSKRGSLRFYPKSTTHDCFEYSTILALQKNDVLKRDFDYLGYAIMLFQLEEYNIILMKQEFSC